MLLGFFPTMSFAAVNCSYSGTLNALCDILRFATDVVRSLLPIFFALALVYFFWGIAMYVKNSGDAKRAAESKTIMIHGVIAIAVMASLWGIVGFFVDLLQINPNRPFNPPVINNL